MQKKEKTFVFPYPFALKKDISAIQKKSRKNRF